MRTGPDLRAGRHAGGSGPARRTVLARGIVLGRQLPSRATLASLAIVMVLSVVPVAVPLLVIRNDATRSLSIGPTSAGAAPAPAIERGSAPTQANADLTGTLTRQGPGSTATPAAPSQSTGAHPPAGPAGHGPDLVVVSLGYTPAQPHPGDRMTFSAVVRNIGDQPSPPITHGVGFLVDGVTVAWSGKSATPIPPGGEHTYVADAGQSGPPFWTATRGGHELKAYADDINRFPETDEDNNTKARQFNVI